MIRPIKSTAKSLFRKKFLYLRYDAPSNHVLLYFQICYGISIAAAVRVGNFLGSGHPDRAKRAMKVAIMLTGIFTAVLFIFKYLITDLLKDETSCLSFFATDRVFWGKYSICLLQTIYQNFLRKSRHTVG